jgi:hypothetical protein
MIFYGIFVKITNYTPKNNANYKSSLDINFCQVLINLKYIAYNLD